MIGDILHEMVCGLQVPIRIGYMRVSKVSAEGQHVFGDSRWPIWTVLQRSGGKGVANVMQPRAWLPRPCTQPELAQEEKEGLIHGRISQGLPSQRDKHMCLRACQLLATIQVEGQLLCCRWMKRHKPTFSELRLADVKSVRTDVIDLECERLGDPQAAGRHQPEERVESMRPQGSCRRELLGFGEDCGDLGRCEDVRSTARTRVMSKDPVRRNLMFDLLSADVACKQDEAVQTTRSLFQYDPGTPVPLFLTRIVGGGSDSGLSAEYDVAPDGRFLINIVSNARCSGSRHVHGIIAS